MEFKFKKILIASTLLVVLSMFFSLSAKALTLKNTYPRLANYFLKWEISDSEVNELAKWDLLILDMEVQENSKDQIIKIRKINPNVIILAYINSVELVDNVDEYNNAEMRNRLASGIIDSWWLKNSSGQKISNWPYSSMLNLTDGAPTDSRGNRFNDYLPNFVVSELKSSGLWDGVFYDNTWGDVAWVNGGNIDANNDGARDINISLDSAWANGFKKVLSKTRSLAGSNFIIVGNGRVYEGYQGILNGVMLESFPSPWENGGTWSGSMKTYLRLPLLNPDPEVTIINSFNKNQFDYKKFRYGLTSTLLGNGFYSFDYDVTSHNQTWWYDEYDISLGSPQSDAYNLLANKGSDIQPGLWRRDFKHGSVMLNSTNKDQLYVFSKEEMEKIKGTQDIKINTGLRISYLKLAPQDGVLLLRQNTVISNNAFTNGYFYRLYNFNGDQVRNGFFPYLNNFAGESEIIIAGQEDNSHDSNLSAGFGSVVLQKNGARISSFYPYSNKYKGKINLSASIENGNFNQIITGPFSGGPQVGIFSSTGKMLGSFMAYDKTSRGGVSVALGDVDGDGQNEIVTGPGAGLEPLIKVFSTKGILKKSFLAYDKNFKGGVSVTIGDVNNDGQNEIVTGPGAGGGPQIRIFNYKGEAIKSFFAYDKNYRGGMRVTVSDVDTDGQVEILAGIKNIY
ncbi:MAG: putative glycoside hydrolase [Patescibacteria group bacterium]